MQAGDKLTLTVRKQAIDTSSVLLQSVSDTDTIKLAPEQTKTLASGSYSYDIQLTTIAGDVFTVAGATSTNNNLSNFVVLPEVTV